WEAAVEIVSFLGIEVVFAMQFIPAVLVARASGRWCAPLVPAIRVFVWAIWPVYGILELVVSFLNVTDEEGEHDSAEPEQQAIEAIVEAATEEGILEQDEARMIEQVVEFSDKR